MKTERITVNKSEQSPAGVEIEVVVPETPLEERTISFLIAGVLRDLKHDNRIPYDLPATFKVEHSRQGSFVVRAFVNDSAMYEPPKPVALVGIQVSGNRLDVIHAAIPAAPPAPAAPADPAKTAQ